jgi:hypothetical protein
MTTLITVPRGTREYLPVTGPPVEAEVFARLDGFDGRERIDLTTHAQLLGIGTVRDGRSSASARRYLSADWPVVAFLDNGTWAIASTETLDVVSHDAGVRQYEPHTAPLRRCVATVPTHGNPYPLMVIDCGSIVDGRQSVHARGLAWELRADRRHTSPAECWLLSDWRYLLCMSNNDTWIMHGRQGAVGRTVQRLINPDTESR